MSGKFIGVGVGPGDPKLMTIKAYELVKDAAVICYLTDSEGHSQAKTIAKAAMGGLATLNPNTIELPIIMPMAKDRTLANAAYDQGSIEISAQLAAGNDVLFLCEGDPLFFGSYSYLLERLQGEFVCEVVPGISSVNAASAALTVPLTTLTDSFAVVSGRHSDQFLRHSLSTYDTVVIMKAGQSRSRILAALEQTNRSGDAKYLEYIGRDQQMIEPDVSQLADQVGPYFSLFVVTRQNKITR